MQYCPLCGVENTDTARFCRQCGSSMTGVGAGVGPAAPGQRISPPVAPGSVPALPSFPTRYKVTKLLGKGGMGAVYLAEDQNLPGRRVALKANEDQSQSAQEQFMLEAQILANLNHPNLPRVTDYFCLPTGQQCLVMDYVEGEDLQKIVEQRGPLPEAEVLPWMEQVCDALQYMHAWVNPATQQMSPVIHRDIKPANIKLTPNGRITLVDFGIAKLQSSMGTGTMTGARAASPGFSPLEQYTGRTDERSDVYALGATAYCLLTGQIPPESPTLAAGTPLPSPRSLNPAIGKRVENAILRAMAQRAADRFPTVVEFRQALTAAAGKGSRSKAARIEPFTFRSGAAATNPVELAAISEQFWDEAVEYLYGATLEAWLQGANRADLATIAADIRTAGGDRSAGLEKFLEAANPARSGPLLQLDPDPLVLPAVGRGQPCRATVSARNAGVGYLSASVQSCTAGIGVTPGQLSLHAGQTVTLDVTIDTSALAEGPQTIDICQVQTDRGQTTVCCQLDVVWPPVLEVTLADRLDFGAVPAGQTQPVDRVFVIRNPGGGQLAGSITTAAAWLRTDVMAFQLLHGEEVQVTAVADPACLSADNLAVSTIRLADGAGRALRDLPAVVSVQKEWYAGWPRAQAWLIYGALMLVGYLGAAVPLALGVCLLFGWPQPEPAVLGLLVAGLALSPVAFHLSPRHVARLDEMEDYHHRARLAPEIACSRFDARRLLKVAAGGAVVGMLAGWRFAAPFGGKELAWTLAGALLGALGGALAMAEGEPSPATPASSPWLAQLWRGPTLATSPTYAVLRSLALLLDGAALGVMLATLAGSSMPVGAIAGAVTGLIVSSESHRMLCARMRWWLGHARLGLWMAAASYLVGSALCLLFDRVALSLAGYGSVWFHFGTVGALLWLILLCLAAAAGGLLGLWVTGGAGQPWPAAQRVYLALLAILGAVTLPVYVLGGVVAGPLGLGTSGRMGLVMLLVAISAGVTARTLRTRYPQVRAGLDKCRQAVAGCGRRLGARWPAPLGRATSLRSFPGRQWLARLGARWRAYWASFGLAEVSAGTTLPLAIGAAGATLVLQPLLANAAVRLVIGLGTVLLWALAAALVVGLLVVIGRALGHH